TYAVVDLPSGGKLSATSGKILTYTPNAGYTGPDSFTFKANDGKVDSGKATVSITVNPIGGISDCAYVAMANSLFRDSQGQQASLSNFSAYYTNGGITGGFGFIVRSSLII